MDQEEIRHLAEKFLNGTATAGEKELLHGWYSASLTETGETVFISKAENSEEIKNRLYNSIQQKLQSDEDANGRRSVRLWPRIVAAAVILVSLSAGLYFYLNGALAVWGLSKDNIAAHDIAPGSNKATLTLSNGKVVALSGSKTGVVINAADLTYNDGSKLKVSSESELRRGSSKASSETLQFTGKEQITLSTPRGGQYQVKLPDGTVIWLNAASTIKFPASFAGLKQRAVVLDGEAYFEVAKSYKPSLREGTVESSFKERIPFVVKTAKQEVEVLGTHFNISSYTDEPATKTTLLEGVVKVSLPHREVFLKPNQQSILTSTGIINTINVIPIDPDTEVAWKNGRFTFNDESIESIMRKIARWYDVEVEYKGRITPKQVFGGTVNKFGNVSKVLEMLELTHAVHFEIEGRKITVMPNP